MIYSLIWIATIAGTSGPITGSVSESTKFKDLTECVEFAKVMAPRMQDWVRGNIRADWDSPVNIHYRCERRGEPA